jgi:predicted nucleic acid-binding protein
LKAKFSLSLTDAWIAYCAQEYNVVLLHKDPEFKPIAIAQELLSLVSKKTAK